MEYDNNKNLKIKVEKNDINFQEYEPIELINMEKDENKVHSTVFLDDTHVYFIKKIPIKVFSPEYLSAVKDFYNFINIKLQHYDKLLNFIYQIPINGINEIINKNLIGLRTEKQLAGRKVWFNGKESLQRLIRYDKNNNINWSDELREIKKLSILKSNFNKWYIPCIRSIPDFKYQIERLYNYNSILNDAYNFACIDPILIENKYIIEESFIEDKTNYGPDFNVIVNDKNLDVIIQFIYRVKSISNLIGDYHLKETYDIYKKNSIKQVNYFSKKKQ